MEKKDILLIKELQEGIKLEKRPFLRIAKVVGCSESDVIAKIKAWLTSGTIRRVGVSVKPEASGYICNALAAWQVPEEQIEEVGNGIAEMPEVSHCYERETPKDWPYNLFTMIHAKTQQELDSIISTIKKKFALTNCRIMKTLKELKKTSMKYFNEGENDL